MVDVFSGKKGGREASHEAEVKELHAKIGELTTEMGSGLQRKWGQTEMGSGLELPHFLGEAPASERPKA